MKTLHVPDAVTHAVDKATSASHKAVDAARHEIDHAVDLVLSPIAPDIENIDLEEHTDRYHG